ncbi:MAG: hypothetical protein CVV18_00430 [Gammaproteobacteria bacterium HGW-Gammaproteobacteria-8]|nr:MAG: hypothetical protein CVV18_00430 [Gammaproteobacteria bacterium HGW-Gammaproteobacteria-8]
MLREEEEVGNHRLTVHIPLAFEARDGSFCEDGFHPSEPSYAEFRRVAGGAFAPGQRSETQSAAGRTG